MFRYVDARLTAVQEQLLLYVAFIRAQHAPDVSDLREELLRLFTSGIRSLERQLSEGDVHGVGRNWLQRSEAQKRDDCSTGATSFWTAVFRLVARKGLGAECTAMPESENGSSADFRPSTSRLKTASGERRTNEGASVGIGSEYGMEMISQERRSFRSSRRNVRWAHRTGQIRKAPVRSPPASDRR